MKSNERRDNVTDNVKKSKDEEWNLEVGSKELQLSLTIMQIDRFHEKKEEFPHYKELMHSLRSIRYCKAEVFRNCILGTLRIPQKNEKRMPLISFGFYLTENVLYLIEETGDLKRWVEKHTDRFQNLKSPDLILLQLMEQMIEKDTLYLSHLEKEMEEMEDTLLHGSVNDFFAVLTKYRQKLSELNAYYEQLTSISDLIQSHDSMILIKSAEPWNRYALRTDRLKNHVQLLRENILQLRELYQSLQDARQNKIMCILTVVTTLFLPLTLLTGWYGMNFSNMPELHWKYGYPMVVLAAILIVVLEIIYFKKRKFF